MTIQNKEELLPCARCREECFIVATYDGQGQQIFLVRPHRISRCKHYKPGTGERICRTIAGTELDAVTTWNASRGVS